MRAFVFPGQGSQVIGMGKDLHDAFPEAKAVFQEVDDALDQNLSKLMFEGPLEELNLTENTQPALMAVSMAVLRVLEKQGNFTLKNHVSYVAGHSLGEYSALAAASTFTLKEAAQLLKYRGQSMQAAVEIGKGGMVALLGANIETATALAEKAAENEVCVVANDNAPGQIVLSGHREAIQRAIDLASEFFIKRAVLLPVSAPFHCPLMAPAALKMQEALNHISLQSPTVPLIANVSVMPVKDPLEIKDLLVQQVTGRVRWREDIEKLAELKVQEIIEIGAGKVLTGLNKRIAPSVSALSIQNSADIDAYLEQL